MNSVTHSLPTVGSQTFAALRRYPDRIAFAWEGGVLTYAETAELIGKMQSVLLDRGLQRGDRIGYLMSNRADAWCAATAAQACGMVVTYLHPLGSLEDHLHQIQDARLAALVIDVDRHGKRGAELAASGAQLKQLFTLGSAQYGYDLVKACAGLGSCTPRDLARPDDFAIMNYTGGTSGKSKAAVRRHLGQSAMTNAILADFDLPQQPRYLAIAPITHVGGTKILPVLLRGGTVYFQDGFDPARVFDGIAAYRINMTLLVPTMIYSLLDAPGLDQADLSSLELLLYGAAPMSPQRLLEGLERIGPVFSQLYGQTECYPISLLPRTAHDRKRPDLFASCGTPVSSCEVTLLGNDGREVAKGEVGEICVRGPHVMEHYWDRPEQTADTIKNGWLHTGDVARLDDQGYLFIVDRKKDMVISGGFNIYTREVENTLAEHPAVATAAAFGVPDPKWGEALVAAVVMRPGAKTSPEVLTAFVKEKKGSLITPKKMVIVDAIPLTSLGKPDKKRLQQQYASDS